jgi:hypothetical protein
VLTAVALRPDLYPAVGTVSQVGDGAGACVQDPSDESPAIWAVSRFYQLFHGYQSLVFSLKPFFESKILKRENVLTCN